MSKITIRLIIALLTFLLGIAATFVFIIHRQQPLNLIVPKGWDAYGFNSIDKRTNEAKLPKLRTGSLPINDLEVRAWIGFGINGDDALILRRSSGQWSALHLHGIFERYPPAKYQETFILSAPKSGWEKAWQRLVEAGILTLPDESELQCGSAILDGVSYAVETNMNNTYRIYSYNNPNYAKCDQAKQMINIGAIISEEFGLEEFYIRE